MIDHRSQVTAKNSFAPLLLVLSVSLTVAAALLPSALSAQTVTFRFEGQVDQLQDDINYFPAVSVGSNFTVDLTYSLDTALYSRAFQTYQTDNNFSPNADFVSWTATFPGRTVHHDDLTDNVGLAGSNFIRLINSPGAGQDQFFVQTDRRNMAAGNTDRLATQFVFADTMVWDDSALLTLPSELDLADWNLQRLFALQYTDGASALSALAYGDVDTLTILDMPGFTIDNPLIPPLGGVVCNGDICTFAIAATATPDHGVNAPLWFDPAIAIGYDYQVDSGPNISGIELPGGFGDDMFDVYYFDEGLNDFVFAATVGDLEPLDLTTYDSEGFSRIRVLGIEEEAMLDPEDTLAFPTGLTFLSEGQVELTMTALTLVPEPSTLVLLGIAAVAGLRRRRVRK